MPHLHTEISHAEHARLTNVLAGYGSKRKFVSSLIRLLCEILEGPDADTLRGKMLNGTLHLADLRDVSHAAAVMQEDEEAVRDDLVHWHDDIQP